MESYGRIHSFQSMGGADGPGMRFVVFMQGCPLRCCYCHNPDTWHFGNGQMYTATQVYEKALRYKPYFGADGGITISGGEALSQPEFVTGLFALCRAGGINTVLDTSGVCLNNKAEAVLNLTDLVICDLKFPSERLYMQHCKTEMDRVLEFMRLAEKLAVPMWMRHVVVPGLTDSEESLCEIAGLARGFTNLQRLELLPFKKLCLVKYSSMNIPFPLENAPECSETMLEKAYGVINS